MNRLLMFYALAILVLGTLLGLTFWYQANVSIGEHPMQLSAAQIALGFGLTLTLSGLIAELWAWRIRNRDSD